MNLIEAIVAATADLVARLGDRDDADARRPSRLPGWTVGHVLSHIALNAEAFVRVATDRRAGRIGTMYPGGIEARADDIEAKADRPMAALVDHVAESSSTFIAAWSKPVPDGPCQSWEGFPPFPAAEVPLRRLREVEVHGLDTGLDGFDHHAWSAAYVEADLPRQWGDVGRRTATPLLVVDETGDRWVTGQGGEAVELGRRTLLAWLLDREAVAVLPTLAPWGDPASWSAHT